MAERKIELQQRIEETDSLKKQLLEKDSEIGKNCSTFLRFKLFQRVGYTWLQNLNNFPVLEYTEH